MSQKLLKIGGRGDEIKLIRSVYNNNLINNFLKQTYKYWNVFVRTKILIKKYFRLKVLILELRYLSSFKMTHFKWDLKVKIYKCIDFFSY